MVAGSDTDVDRATAKTLIDYIHKENHEFYSTDLGQAALKDLQQTFPLHWLYVGELLQNAVDAGAKHIRLEVVPEGLLFEHDGVPFSRDHVRALCARGLSTKGAGTVGFMGIGFKAVFQSFERASISSGPWRFGFIVKEETGEYGERLRDWLGCVLPSHVDVGDSSPGMQCRFLLSERLSRLGPVYDDVANVLSSDLTVLALLAQRGVEELSWNGKRWQLTKTKCLVDERTTRVELGAKESGSGEVRSWVMFSATYQPSRDAIARFLEHRQKRPSPEVYAEAARTRTVDVFCPLDPDGVPVPPKRRHAYALLSTGATVPIGLNVQADWLLNTSRRELMDVETNAWHQEILSLLAGLLRSYLSWVTSLPGLADNRLAAAYAVLPSWSEVDGEFGTYTKGTAFMDALRGALADLSFLPVRTKDGNRFLTPGEARLLPSALRGFDTPKLLPWMLLGEKTISTTILGDATLGSLERLGLLQSLTPDELVTHWETGVVGRWREGLSAVANDAHLTLIRVLASLESVPSWRDARLCCLPMADGGWLDRYRAVGLPAEWDSIPNEDPPVRSLLDPFLAPIASRLEWSFDRLVQRDIAARSYLSSLARDVLETVLDRWWNAFSSNLDEASVGMVLDVTCWVRNKQRQRPGLVKRVLCDVSGGLVLISLDVAVLSAPYASAARRYFFPDRQPVSDRYLHHQSGASEADWRSFFEAASPALGGPFRLVRSVKELSWSQLTEALPGYTPPSRKAGTIRALWEGMRFSSDNYLLIDTCFPEVLGHVLAGRVSREAAVAVGEWLDEARQVLLAGQKRHVVYVPYFSSSVVRNFTGFASPWVDALQGAQWLYGSDGSGPYAPAQLLPRPDLARPDAVFVDLPAELVKTLENCGLRFGTVVPDVLSVERLRREGPSASVERVVELLELAIAETAEDPKARDDLARLSQLGR